MRWGFVRSVGACLGFDDLWRSFLCFYLLCRHLFVWIHPCSSFASQTYPIITASSTPRTLLGESSRRPENAHHTRPWQLLPFCIVVPLAILRCCKLLPFCGVAPTCCDYGIFCLKMPKLLRHMHLTNSDHVSSLSAFRCRTVLKPKTEDKMVEVYSFTLLSL